MYPKISLSPFLRKTSALRREIPKRNIVVIVLAKLRKTRNIKYDANNYEKTLKRHAKTKTNN